MGRTTTPTYRLEIEIDDTAHACTPSAWRPEYGRPTEKNIKKWVDGFEQSSRPGGCNQHLGEQRVLAARTIRQRSGETIAKWTRPGYTPTRVPLFLALANL